MNNAQLRALTTHGYPRHQLCYIHDISRGLLLPCKDNTVIGWTWPQQGTHLSVTQPEPEGGAVQNTWILVRLRGVLSVTAGGQLVMNWVSSSSMIWGKSPKNIQWLLPYRLHLRQAFTGAGVPSQEFFFFYLVSITVKFSFCQTVKFCVSVFALPKNKESKTVQTCSQISNALFFLIMMSMILWRVRTLNLWTIQCSLYSEITRTALRHSPAISRDRIDTAFHSHTRPTVLKHPKYMVLPHIHTQTHSNI